MTSWHTEVSRTVAVASGSGAGAVCRWWIGWIGDSAAWDATLTLLAVNAAGAFAIGALSMQDWSRLELRAPARAVLLRDIAMSGFCGGFTAFSLFNADLLRMAERAGTGAAVGLVAVSVALWLGGVLAGRAMGGRIAHALR